MNPKEALKKENEYWRKALVGAKLLLHKGKKHPSRCRAALMISNDPGVSERLLKQAVACISFKKKLDYEEVKKKLKIK
jgi:hypothetical protein